MSRAIVWFRRDLRLHDNPALARALDQCEQVYLLYCLDRQLPPSGGASDVWLHHSLQQLSSEIAERGAKLWLLQPPKTESFADYFALLATKMGVNTVYWNRLYDPATIDRDKRVKKALQAVDIDAESCSAALLQEPWNIATKSDTPFRVFTPFWKQLQKQLAEPRSLAVLPDDFSIAPLEQSLQAEFGLVDEVAELELLPQLPWAESTIAEWQVGATAAEQRLESFLQAANDYPEGRDVPSINATSGLSPALHFGEISPMQVWQTTQQAKLEGVVDEGAADKFLSEVAWREFAHHLLYHYPHTTDKPLNEKFADFPWRQESDYQQDLQAWQQGLTGVPMVDAGMRQLWQTGWMHNRVRMLVGSYLCKNLLIPWQEGAAWFWDTLFDADLANNSLGWQWIAGSGADAAPYFRIFNPVTQGERFDPDGEYVRRWLPGLKELPKKYVHAPWTAPADVLKEAGVVLGEDYPEPLCDLAESRKKALAAYQEIKG